MLYYLKKFPSINLYLFSIFLLISWRGFASISITGANSYPFIASHFGNPLPLGFPVFMKFRKYVIKILETL